MKKIFVTVAEFLDNGGEFADGREICNYEGYVFGLFREIHSFDGVKYIKVINGDSYPTHSTYVQIDCKPIYL